MKTIFTPEHNIFCQSMIAARKTAKLTQAMLAKSLNKPQSFVAKYERGERRLDVIEFLLVTRAIGINPGDIIQEVEKHLDQASCREKR